MSDEIPNLWPSGVGKLDVRSPVAILRAQAEQLTRMTKGVIRAEVVTSQISEPTSKPMLEHALDATAPAAKNIRRRVVTVRHERDGAYPVYIHELADGDDWAADEQVFLQKLKRVFAEQLGVIQSLIARSNEMGPSEAR